MLVPRTIFSLIAAVCRQSAMRTFPMTTSPQEPKPPSTTTPVFTKRPITVFRRQLPSTSIPFASDEGKALFAEALASKGLEAYCGLSTLTMVLNALSVDPGRAWKGPWRHYHEEMLDCCEPLEVVRERGIVMRKFACLARCNGAEVVVVPASDDGGGAAAVVGNDAAASNGATSWGTGSTGAGAGSGSAGAGTGPSSDAANCLANGCGKENGGDANGSDTGRSGSGSTTESAGLAAFRATVRRVCAKAAADEVVVAAYDRAGLGQTGTGHYSPIGGHHAGRDMVLILDVARFKYPPHWVPLSALWAAMRLPDPETSRPRGYITVKRGRGDLIGQGCFVTAASAYRQWPAVAAFVQSVAGTGAGGAPHLHFGEPTTSLADFVALVVDQMPDGLAHFLTTAGDAAEASAVAVTAAAGASLGCCGGGNGGGDAAAGVTSSTDTAAAIAAAENVCGSSGCRCGDGESGSAVNGADDGVCKAAELEVEVLAAVENTDVFRLVKRLLTAKRPALAGPLKPTLSPSAAAVLAHDSGSGSDGGRDRCTTGSLEASGISSGAVGGGEARSGSGCAGVDCGRCMPAHMVSVAIMALLKVVEERSERQIRQFWAAPLRALRESPPVPEVQREVVRAAAMLDGLTELPGLTESACREATAGSETEAATAADAAAAAAGPEANAGVGAAMPCCRVKG